MKPNHLKILLEGLATNHGGDILVQCKGGQIRINTLLLASISHNWLVKALKETQTSCLIMPFIDLNDVITFMNVLQKVDISSTNFKSLHRCVANLAPIFNLGELSDPNKEEQTLSDDFITSNYSDQEGRLVCLVCYKMFKNDSFDQFRLHMKTHPITLAEKTQTRLKVECDDCDFTCDTFEGKVAHTKKHKLKIHGCKNCSRLFQSVKLLESHVKSEMCKASKRICTICNKILSDSTRLKHHMKTHSGEKPWNCFICDKNFSELRSLKEHKLIHAPERQFHCKECGKKFVQKNHLAYHQASKHGEVKSKSHSCLHCCKTFAFPFQLKKHVAVCHANK